MRKGIRRRGLRVGKGAWGVGVSCSGGRLFFFFQAEDGIRDYKVTGVQTCALPILGNALMAMTAGTPCRRMLAICLRRFAAPAATSSGFSARRSSGSGLPAMILYLRSEERRVGEEGRTRGAPDHLKKKKSDSS